jgi:hypothetical protein
MRLLIRGRPAPPCILDALKEFDRQRDWNEVKTLLKLSLALLILFFAIYSVTHWYDSL